MSSMLRGISDWIEALRAKELGLNTQIRLRDVALGLREVDNLNLHKVRTLK